MNILLLDDNLMSSHRLQAALAEHGHGCRVETAAAALRDDDDLVVVNLGSRSIDGEALVRQVKAARPGVPVHGFCGHLEVDRRRAAKAAGVDRLFTNSDLAERPDAIVALAG